MKIKEISWLCTGWVWLKLNFDEGPEWLRELPKLFTPDQLL